jgi:hypothetical protein
LKHSTPRLNDKQTAAPMSPPDRPDMDFGLESSPSLSRSGLHIGSQINHHLLSVSSLLSSLLVENAKSTSVHAELEYWKKKAKEQAVQLNGHYKGPTQLEAVRALSDTSSDLVVAIIDAHALPVSQIR